MDQLADQLAADSYVRGLAIVTEDLTGGTARLRLPFSDEIANPGGALHGGIVASMVDIAGAAAARTTLEPGTDWETAVVDLEVDYLAAAIREDIVGEAGVLRKGKELSYVDVSVRTAGGKPIARGLVTHRAVPAGGEVRTFGTPPDPDSLPPGEVSSFGRMFMMVPFIARLGMQNERMKEGTARLRLPFAESNANGDGAIHEGALAALVDTAGAVASWSVTGPDPSYKASTVGVHAGFVAPARGEDVVALARTVARREELFWNSVEVVGVDSGSRIVQASVLYRIVVPRA